MFCLKGMFLFYFNIMVFEIFFVFFVMKFIISFNLINKISLFLNWFYIIIYGLNMLM